MGPILLSSADQRSRLYSSMDARQGDRVCVLLSVRFLGELNFPLNLVVANGNMREAHLLPKRLGNGDEPIVCICVCSTRFYLNKKFKQSKLSCPFPKGTHDHR